MINGAAVVLKYKEEAVKWINSADPIKNDQVNSLTDFLSRRLPPQLKTVLAYLLRINYGFKYGEKWNLLIFLLNRQPQ